ncbi:hypothetical protein ACHHYP_05231 [Achlya hypogyna]|uniref:EF-hand domain-containing protein n=1 Tax=Achlya hypogyna TaxID=1202772 RepID=A0A1V9YYG4_ACHHY|nr:hypothetical protein ACHHYP_05231 [Achlya hypogyna]
MEATVNELVQDLFLDTDVQHRGDLRAKGLSMADAILSALARLAATNGQSQAIVATALAPRWAEYCKFLYAGATSMSALTCLAACTRASRLHQRQVVRAIPGVFVPTATAMCFAVCVPERVNVAFKEWKRRQKELQGHRIPYGTPPDAAGAPAPCYCNDCLGTPQHFRTWRNHYHDLKLWRDLDAELPSEKSSLSLTDYLLAAMSFHGVSFEVHQVPLDRQQPQGPVVELRSLYLPTSDAAPVADSSQVINPHQHIVALPVDESLRRELQLVVDAAHRLHKRRLDACDLMALPPVVAMAAPIHEPPPAAVVLHDALQRLPMCRFDVDEFPPPPKTNPLVEYLRGLHHLFQSLDPNGDGSVSKAEFTEALQHHPELRSQLTDDESLALSDEGEGAEERRLQLLFDAIGADTDAFVWDDFVTYFGAPERMKRIVVHATKDHCLEVEATMASMLRCLAPHEDAEDGVIDAWDQHNCAIRVVAQVDERQLRIEATCQEAGKHVRFVSRIHCDRLCLLDPSPWSLLQLSSESVASLVSQCVLCRHRDPSTCAAGAFARVPLREEMADSLLSSLANTSPTTKARANPIPGLSSLMEAGIKDYLHALRGQLGRAEFHFRDHGTAFAAGSTKKLKHWVAECNARVTALATAAAFPQSTHPLRMAARDRCQDIRRDLIDAIRRVSIYEARAWTADATVAAVEALCSTLEKVLVRSADVQYWETPDATIESLGLSNTVWANGYPDAQYPKATEAARQAHKSRSNKLKIAVQMSRRATPPGGAT